MTSLGQLFRVMFKPTPLLHNLTFTQYRTRIWHTHKADMTTWWGEWYLAIWTFRPTNYWYPLSVCSLRINLGSNLKSHLLLFSSDFVQTWYECFLDHINAFNEMNSFYCNFLKTSLQIFHNLTKKQAPVVTGMSPARNSMWGTLVHMNEQVKWRSRSKQNKRCTIPTLYCNAHILHCNARMVYMCSAHVHHVGIAIHTW